MGTEEMKKELVEKIFMTVQQMLVVGKIYKDKPILDLGVTLQLVLLLASQKNLEELKVFLKNYMLLDEVEKQSPMERLLNIPVCLN